MKKSWLLFVLLTCVLGLTGCPNYDKVREMSKKQLAAQNDFKTFFGNYMTKVYTFSELQVGLSKRRLEQLERDVDANIQATGDGEINALPAGDAAGRNARRQQIGAEKLQNKLNYKAKRDELDKLLTDLQAKHREILDTYQVLIDAQTELDRYVQLKRFDERVVDAVVQRINLNQDKLNQRINEATALLTRISQPPTS